MIKKYSSYKDTGISWLGSIPSDWDLKRVGNFFVERSVKVDDISFPPLSVTKSGIVEQLKDVAKTNDGDNRKLVRKDDFVINSRSDRKGSSGIAKRDGSVSLINIVLKPLFIEPQFIEYLFKSYYFKEEFFRNGKGIHWDLWTTRWEQFKNINIPVPSKSEQVNIGIYLNKKTQKIDSLLKKLDKKINLLQEQKNVVIGQYVTKGLDPNSPMKYSGIDWIGEIPENWLLKRVRYLCDIKTGGKDTQDNVEGGEFPFFVRSPKIERINSFSYDGEAVLTSGDGAGVGKIFHYFKGKFDYHQRVYKFSNFRKIEGRFFYWFFKEHFSYEILRWNAKSTVDSVRLPLIQNFPIVIPPSQTQRDIVEIIEKNSFKFEKLIEKMKRKIELLKEYRQSLIASVVTGKIRISEEMI